MNRRLVCALLLFATTAHAEPPPSGRFTIGAGFGADEGFVGVAEVANDDLFGTGHQLSLSAEVSALRQDFRMRYVAPGVPADGFQLGGELFARRRQYEGFTRDGTGGEVALGRWLDRHTRVDVRYRLERVAVELDAAAAGARVLAPAESTIATAGVGIVHDTLDGTRLELTGEVADPRLGSDHRFARVRAAAIHARPLGPLTLRLQGRAGYVHGLGGERVPLSERFQHDGHADIRGYALGDFGGLGGHELEALGRIALEAPLLPRLGLSVAAFADAGLGYNRDPAWGPTGLRVARSVGLSLIWRSPIGPLSFDWAIPLDRGDRAPQFLFGVGTGGW